MRHLARVLHLFAAVLLGLALAACTITSDKPLFDDEELAAPLPDAFTFFPYEAQDGAYVRSDGGPAHFVRQGNAYVASDVPETNGPLSVRFMPVGDEVYLLAATIGSEPTVVYGFARYADSVLAVALSPGKATAEALGKARHGSMPQARKALAGLKVSGDTGEIAVRSREALDFLAAMYVAGKLPMDGLSVGYLARDPDATPPARLMPAGRDWVRQP